MADNEYLDVTSFRPRGGGKKYGQKIGSAKSDGKGGYWVSLDALPLPDAEGRVSILIAPRQAKGDYQKPPARRAEPVAAEDPMNDEIPW